MSGVNKLAAGLAAGSAVMGLFSMIASAMTWNTGDHSGGIAVMWLAGAFCSAGVILAVLACAD